MKRANGVPAHGSGESADSSRMDRPESVGKVVERRSKCRVHPHGCDDLQPAAYHRHTVLSSYNVRGILCYPVIMYAAYCSVIQLSCTRRHTVLSSYHVHGGAWC